MVIAIQQLSTNWNFETVLNQVLRDRLVVGLEDESLIRKLLSENKLTFEKACTLLPNMEMIKQECRDMKVEPKGNTTIQAVSSLKKISKRNHKIIFRIRKSLSSEKGMALIVMERRVYEMCSQVS